MGIEFAGREVDARRHVPATVGSHLRCLLGVGLALSISVGSAAAATHPTCTLYQDRNFGGAHWVLRNGDDLQMINPPSVGTSDAIHRYLYNASWNDQVSSFRVSPGCTLTLWEDVNKGGHHFRSNRSYSYLGSDWNDKASEALCECQEAGMPNF